MAAIATKCDVRAVQQVQGGCIFEEWTSSFTCDTSRQSYVRLRHACAIAGDQQRRSYGLYLEQALKFKFHLLETSDVGGDMEKGVNAWQML